MKPPALAPALHERTSGMMNLRLFAAHARLAATREEMAPLVEAHVAFLVELERAGALFASGPFFDQAGAPTGDGMTIVRAESITAARALLERDPFVQAGVRTFELREWHLMEGTIVLTVRASARAGLLT
jgi:uncharacterized protein YciI